MAFQEARDAAISPSCVEARNERPQENCVDGVPILRLDGGRAFTPSLRSLDAITLTSAASAAHFGASVVEYTTVRPADTWNVDARVLSDALSPSDWSQRTTRLDLGAGGPVPGIDGLSAAVSANLAGQRYHQLPAGTSPLYVASGIDTTITLATVSGEVDVAVPEYVLWDATRLPLGNDDHTDLFAALSYVRGDAEYGLHYYGSSVQSMTRALEHIYNPDAWRGDSDDARILTLSLNRPLPFGITADALLSHQRFDHTRGMLDPVWASANAQPSLGITTDALGFIADVDDWPVTDAMLAALRSGVLPAEESSVTTGNNPLVGMRHGVPGVSQSLRLNPYAMRTGFPISGLGAGSDVALAWSQERHWYGRVHLRRAIRSWDVGFGGEIDRARVQQLELPLADGLIAAHQEDVNSAAVFARAGTTMGALRIDGGLRIDHRSSDRRLPRVPGFVTSIPDSLRGDAWTLRPGTEPWQDRLEPLVDCGGAATAAQRTNPVTGETVCLDNFVPVESHTS